MKLEGEFSTTTSIDRLLAGAGEPGVLAGVASLSDVERRPDGAIGAVFHPVTPLGRMSLRTVITRTEEDRTEGGTTAVRLRVVGRRGVQAVDCDLCALLSVEGTGAVGGTTVRWSADLVVRGNAASVGQRVAREVAARAVATVLQEVAAASAPGPADETEIQR